MVTQLYTHYLVCYDIPNDKKRRRFSEKLKDLGLIPIQKSVFYGGLRPADVKDLELVANDCLDKDIDKCFWFACRLNIDDIKLCIGYQNFEFTEPDGHGFI